MTDNSVSIEDRLRAKADTLTEAVTAEVQRARAVFVEENMPGLVDVINEYIGRKVPTMPAVNGVGYHLQFDWAGKRITPLVWVTYNPNKADSDWFKIIEDSVELLRERLQKSGVTAKVDCHPAQDTDSFSGIFDFVYSK